MTILSFSSPRLANKRKQLPFVAHLFSHLNYHSHTPIPFILNLQQISGISPHSASAFCFCFILFWVLGMTHWYRQSLCDESIRKNWTCAAETRSALLGWKITMAWVIFGFQERYNAQFAWAEKQNEEVDKLFSLLQREIYLKEELHTLKKLQSFTRDEKKRIKGLEEEIKTFDKQYWLQKRAYHRSVSYIGEPKGPLIRYWDMMGDNDSLHSVGTQDFCKANGGCCAYDCGCCQRPLKTARDNMKGHCSMECGCCIQRRGFYTLEPSLSHKSS